MNINIVAVGRIKESYLKEALKEYQKRLTSYCNLFFTEITPEQILDDNLSEKYKLLEAQRILSVLKPDSYIITLEITGKMFSSEEFAEKISEISNSGINEISFVIGGANGLHKSVSSVSNLKLSFSKMTYTHQMIRLLLTEQIYRAFKINTREPYHR